LTFAVCDEQTITCQVDRTGAAPGPWNLVVTPPPGLIAECTLENALEIVQP